MSTLRLIELVSLVAWVTLGGVCTGQINPQMPKSNNTNPKLVNLPPNQWVRIHQQQKSDDLVFRRQALGAPALTANGAD